ncbi:MAG: type II toxin-antitoxin system VapC family toxin [Candidatus Sumerlaeota bacterium]|nr:type II toxin-antitoxin system VapC family toxin [Candidatus Sumerlaeota bacterium]
MDKPRLYLETSIVSYYKARLSRDVLVLAHQQITMEFWERRLSRFALFISPIVLAEAGEGNPEAARARLEALRGFGVLPLTAEAERMASLYRSLAALPAKAYRDSLHIALASVHEMDYLATWNCSHIAGAETRRKVAEINKAEGVGQPMLCTPEELMEG